MAYWRREAAAEGRTRVCVFVWRDGAQRRLARAETKHLDHEPDSNVDFWVRAWSERNGESTVERPTLRTSDVHLVEAYVGYLKSLGTKSPKTLHYHRHLLTTLALPYFSLECGLDDCNAWPSVATRLTAWVRAKGESESQVQKLNAALRGLWEWLADEGHVLGGVALRLRRPIRRETVTPLPKLVYPDEALAALSGAPSTIAFLGLCGYFLSLRPQETFALRPSDFRAGRAATELEACRASARLVNYGRLAANVTRQRRQDGSYVPPKRFSVGWVSCFDERAARRLVELLQGKDASQSVLWTARPDHWLAAWRVWAQADHALKGMTLKDLRRASAHWLGHYTGFANAGTNLQKHLRHKDPKTTQLYLRRPDEDGGDFVELDLDA